MNSIGEILVYCDMYDDFIGVCFIWICIFEKYLDVVNFLGGVNLEVDLDSMFFFDIFYIMCKVLDKVLLVEFDFGVLSDL